MTAHTVHHDAIAQRFWIALADGGPRGVLDYTLNDRSAVFTHTGVPAELRGHGLAASLVEAALHWARTQGLHVVPACSYVDAYLRRKPEWQDLRAAD